MAITLSVLTDFQNSFTAESQLNFQQNPYNTSHHTFNVLPHYLAKIEFEFWKIWRRTTSRAGNACFHSTGSLWPQNSPDLTWPDLTWPQNSPDLKPCQLDLQDAGRRPAASLPVAGASHWWTELAWHWPDHHWQCNWRVAWTSLRMCAGKKAETSSNYCDNIQPHDKRRFSFCQMWHDF